MAWNGQFGRLLKSAGFRKPLPKNTREPARSGKKKPQPRTVGVLLLVEVAGFEPASDNLPTFDLHA